MSSSPLEFLARRLSQRAPLSEDDVAAVSSLPHTVRIVHAATYLVREGEPPKPYCALVISGMAFRHKLTVLGARQIVSLHLRGDILDLQHLFLNIADHSVQALTELDVAEIDREALREVALARPAIGQALWIEGLVDASIYREWVLNVGRRDARARIAHILCEIAIRMHAAEIIEAERFQLPMTQEQLGDATGLTSVHVNRTMKALAADGLIEQAGRWISIRDWNGIRREGDFNPLYLHLDQVAPHFGRPLSALFSRRG
ncbi:Crp/Fnr family transcriptional regulator [Sphingomonas panacis]|uniref:Crp/Fnr family transcriptional regulator n=1 Tax=Sphingomonas panacis TaxID=1560345 RepID=A0A1B3ZFX1_9SPHN|nr:Crp/Fnr family transcriptional regulator [Sphingomonas panacis]AOH86318.1 Crp/Fnr family transcriptional regulator [Sphingomonas panacis]